MAFTVSTSVDPSTSVCRPQRSAHRTASAACFGHRTSMDPSERALSGLTSEQRQLLTGLSRSQDAVVTRRQLADVGVHRALVRQRFAARVWRPLGTRLVLLTAKGPSRRMLLRGAALAAAPRGVLAGRSGLELRGLDSPAHEPVHVQVPAGRRVTAFVGVVVHSTYFLQPDDLVELDGIQTTTAARATVDAARWEGSPRAAAGIVLASLQQRLCSVEEIETAIARFEKFQQSAAVRQALLDALDGADSVGEVDVSDLVVRAGLPRPERQFVLETPEGPRPYDLAVELPDGTLLLIEVDGPRHREERVQRNDRLKDRAAAAAGHLLIRIDPYEAWRDPWTVLAMLRTIAAEHSAP